MTVFASPAHHGWLWLALATATPTTALVMLAVARGWTDGLDDRLFLRMRFPLRHPDGSPKRLATAARDLIALGGDMVRLLFVAGCVIGLVADRRATTALALTVIVAVARLSLFLLKRVVRRPRPDVDRQAVVTFTSSFPSGHSFMAVVTYASAAILITAGMPTALIAAAIGFSLLLSLAIGIVRVALGVHWPTDIVAGWCAAIAWTSASLLLIDPVLR